MKVPHRRSKVHQLLVHSIGNFGVQLKETSWWPTLQDFHAVALLCAPHYKVSEQYLCESWSKVPPLPSSCVATLGGTITQLLCSSGTLKIVILLCILMCFPPYRTFIMVIFFYMCNRDCQFTYYQLLVSISYELRNKTDI